MKDIVTEQAARNRLQTGIWKIVAHCNSNGEIAGTTRWRMMAGTRMVYYDRGMRNFDISYVMGVRGSLFREVTDDV